MEKRFDEKKSPPGLIRFFFLLFSIESFISAYSLIQIPNDGKNQFLFGFSAERLGLLGILILLGIVSLVAFFFFSFHEAPREKLIGFCEKNRSKLFRWVQIITIVCFFLILTPAYRFQRFAAYFQRFRPFFLLGLMGGASAFICLHLQYSGMRKWISAARELIKNQRALFLPMGIFLLCWIFVRISGWGITAGNEAWYANAVPLQSIQIVLLLILLIIFYKIIQKRMPEVLSRRSLIFFVIWGLAALVWSFAPMERHFFAPGPYLPNNEFYPYSDATLNDVAAQSALNGLGFNFNALVLKPVVTFVSFLGSIVSGGQMNTQLMLQSAFYAILPAILYLFASELGGSFSGLLAAGLMILHEWNALNTTHILTIHSRLEMGEFPSEIILAALSLFVFRWFKKSEGMYRYAAAAGGMLALGIYTRYNLFGMIPAILLLALIAFWKKKRLFLRSSLVFMLSLLISAGPWLYRSYQLSGEFLPEVFGAFRAVVVDQRLKPILEENTEITPAGPAVIDAEEAPPATMEKFEATQPVSETVPAPDVREPAPNSLRVQLHPLIDTLGNHFFHNVIAMAFIMPVRLTFDDLDHLYTAETSVWADGWDGTLSWGQRTLLLINLLLVSAVLAAIWKKFGFPGISFLFLLLAYAGSLGLARTSGGRYLVPMNWGVILLYACGLGLLSRIFLRQENRPEPAAAWQKDGEAVQRIPFKQALLAGLPVTACFFLFFLSMLIAEKRIPNQLTTLSSQEILQTFREKLEIDPDWKKIEKQVSDGEMKVYQGKALYPRFYYFNTGEHGTDQAYQYKNYSRLVFKLVGEDGMLDLVMPISAPPDIFPNNADVIALACNEAHFIDVLAVSGTHRNGEAFTYVRTPLREFACPAAEPVCTQVDACY